jgi:hypothetical protein
MTRDEIIVQLAAHERRLDATDRSHRRRPDGRVVKKVCTGTFTLTKQEEPHD